MDFDNFLKKGGEFGKYQIYLFFLSMPFNAFSVIALLGQLFISATPDHWCNVPQLYNASIEETKFLFIPKEDMIGIKKYSRCKMYNGTYDEILKGLGPKGQLPVISCQNGWRYDLSEIPYNTIVSEYDWVCDKDSYASVAQGLFFTGALVGGIVFGVVADMFGRVPVLICTNIIGGIAGSATAAVRNFWQFALCRFCVGLCYDNCFLMMYILALEYIGPRYRTLVANLSIGIFFTLFTVLLPWVAYWIRDWRLFALTTSLPMLSAVLSIWLVPESARWLVLQGQVDRAMKLMRNYFKMNNAKVTEKEIEEFQKEARKIANESDALEVTYTMMDVAKTPRLRRNMFLLTVLWMIMCLCFDGHIRNVGNLGYSMFVTSSVTSFTELPADLLLIVTLDRFGRRWMACVFLLVSGVLSAAAVLIPTDEKVVYFALAILGRFCINVAYSIGLQYAAEVLPTVVRGQGTAFIHIMGYLASFLSPVIVYLAIYGQFVPLLIMGLAAIVGATISLFLPETLNQELPETLDDGRKFGKDQKFWNFPCLDKTLYESKETIEVANEQPRVSVSSRRYSVFGQCDSKANLRRASHSFAASAFLRSSMLSGQIEAIEEATSTD